MKIFDFNDMKGGWFVGNFAPSAFNTSEFEVCYKTHTKGEKWDVHFHKEATEINLLIDGIMSINDTLVYAGQIFVIYPYEVADPVFLTDCKLVIVKTPSIIGDKYAVVTTP